MGKMNDTSPFMQRKQVEIYQSKTPQERFQMVMEMRKYGVNQTKEVIRINRI